MIRNDSINEYILILLFSESPYIDELRINNVRNTS